MDKSRTKLLFGVLLAAIAVAVVVFLLNAKESKPAPSAPGYYSGPFRNRANPNIYGSDDGKQVAAPPGDSPATSGDKPDRNLKGL